MARLFGCLKVLGTSLLLLSRPSSLMPLNKLRKTLMSMLRHTLLPKSGDHRMIRGHSINFLQLFNLPQKFKVMSLIVKTIKRTTAGQNRSCGYAPHIQMLINSKMGKGMYLLDKEHLPLRITQLLWMLQILHK